MTAPPSVATTATPPENALPPRRPPRVAFAWGVGVAFLLIAIVRILHHVPWRDEVRAWQLVLSVDSLWGLREATKYDGHPPLWSLLLYGLSRFTHDFRAVQILHAAISSLAVGLLAGFAPWRRCQIALACLGYFVLFEYTIVARNYGLGLLFFVAALVALERGKSRWGFAACCAAAIQSNTFATLLVGGLGLVAIVSDIQHQRRAEGWIAYRSFLWILLPIASGILALIAMLPGPTERYANPYDGTAPLRRASVIFAGVERALIPIPANIDAWWNSAMFSIDIETARANPALYHTISAITAIGFAGLLWLFRSRRYALLFVASTTTAILLFSFAQFAGSQRHNGHVVLALLGGWWLTSSERPASALATMDRRRDLVLSALLVVQAIAGVVASYRDLAQPFSAAPATGQWLRDNSRGVKLIGNPDYAAVPVAAAAGLPFFSPESFDFVTWNTQGPQSPLRLPYLNDEPNLLAAILRHTGQQEMLLIRPGLVGAPAGQSAFFDIEDRTAGLSRQTGQTLAMTPIIEFPASAVPDERYTIILVRVLEDRDIAAAASQPVRRPAH